MNPWSREGPVVERGDSHFGESLVVVAYVIFASCLIVGPFALYAVYSGAMRWIITLILVSFAGIFAAKVLYPLGEASKGRGGGESASRGKDGYAALKEMAERAEGGFAYSQKALNERIADAFLEKLRVKRGLQPQAVFRLSEDRQRLFAACGDGELADFVVESKTAMTEKTEKHGLFGRKGMAKDGAAYKARAQRMIAKIEAWEG